MIAHISKKLTGDEQLVITMRKTITIGYKPTKRTKRKINGYKHANKMKKRRKEKVVDH